MGPPLGAIGSERLPLSELRHYGDLDQTQPLAQMSEWMDFWNETFSLISFQAPPPNLQLLPNPELATLPQMTKWSFFKKWTVSKWCLESAWTSPLAIPTLPEKEKGIRKGQAVLKKNPKVKTVKTACLRKNAQFCHTCKEASTAAAADNIWWVKLVPNRMRHPHQPCSRSLIPYRSLCLVINPQESDAQTPPLTDTTPLDS